MDQLAHNKKLPFYILILSGPAASGKSSVATSLWKELPDRPAYIDVDSLKNMIWQAPSNDHNLDLASKNALSLVRNFLADHHSVILDKAFGRYSFVMPFIQEAKRWNCVVHYFKLTAPLDVLIHRNRERHHYTSEILMQQARWRPFRAPDDNVIRIYDFFTHNNHPEGIEIDTTGITLSKLIEKIRSIVMKSCEHENKF
ncbi:MAG: AAA family ATPase [Sedimentisphaerales bacterium]|nr:AAA family ATPase [Sedimentisphaerales bacterium]